MRISAHIIRLLLLCLLTSCMRERPRDLRLEQVYLANISATSIYKPPVANGMLSPPLRLAIELSTTETFPLGARIVWGFCGDRSWPEYLYRETDPSAEADAGRYIRDEPSRHRYLAIPVIVFKLVPPKPELPDYDLVDDSRDICMTTG